VGTRKQGLGKRKVAHNGGTLVDYVTERKEGKHKRWGTGVVGKGCGCVTKGKRTELGGWLGRGL